MTLMPPDRTSENGAPLPEIWRFPAADLWVKKLVMQWARAEDKALRERGRFTAALAGGGTPKRLYEALTKGGPDWSRTYLFLGDERCVPSDHEESNYRMIRETLVIPAGILPEQVFRWRTELGAKDAAEDYEGRLRGCLGEPPVLDLVLLGLGNDGHTASLFPGTPALEERERWAVANPVPQLDTTRLTLTYPAILAARDIWFLVAGSGKREVFEAILSPSCPLPAARVLQQRAVRMFFLEEGG